MNPLVSIVIPVYNIEEHLLQSCINTVLNQTYTNIEVILIDDGSKEEARIICDKIACKDLRIKVIHQENQGVSAARNNGTVVASGEYVIYVDGDDVISPIAVEEGVKHLIEDRVDAVFSGMEQIKQHEDFSKISTLSERFEIIREGQFDEIKRHLFAIDNPKFLKIMDRGYITRGPVCRMIRRTLALQNQFPLNIPIGEDLIWNMNLLNLCSSICVVYNIWYGYLKAEDSAIRKYYGNRIESVEEYLRILRRENEEFCEKNKDVYGKNVAVEFYCILRYELLSDKCRLTEKEKNRIVHAMLCREPWKTITGRETMAYLSMKYKVLILLSKTRLWQKAMKLMYNRRTK